MTLVAIAYNYLKRYPILSVSVVFLIVVASLFEGASFAMLIPLIKAMTTDATGLIEKIPFIENLDLSVKAVNQGTIISAIFILLLFLVIFKNVFIYFSNLLIARLRFNLVRDLRLRLMNKLLEYDTSFFDGAKIGHIISNISYEVERIGNFALAVLQFIALSGRVCAYMLLLFLISWKLSIVVFALIAMVILPLEFIMKKLEKIGINLSAALADFNYKLTEILGGIRLIKQCSTEDLEKRNFKAVVKNLWHFQFKNNKYIYLIMPLCEVLIFTIVVICFLVAINVSKINIAGTFPLIATYLLVLGKTLTQLNTLNSGRAEAMSNLAAFTNYERMCEESDKRTLKSGKKMIDRFSHSLEFKHASFSYMQDREVLKDVSIVIPNGKITALVGASGAGKSTIVNLILRFYDLKSGVLLVDGIDIKDLSLKEWRRKIGFVSQDAFIFNVSVKANIAYGHSDISQEELVRAAKAANAHSFIAALPRGYDTVLGERGVKLSGGQKQRLSIARAIMHNPEILVLDEATSSLDTETERLITESIDKLTKDRTVIAIAHRLSTILHADNIIVLSEGGISEEGSHADLLEKDGLYKRLYDAQFSV
ncbi:MAG: ABC transporter ATP-binding protein [Candidatus Omnitrophota bacterium]